MDLLPMESAAPRLRPPRLARTPPKAPQVSTGRSAKGRWGVALAACAAARTTRRSCQGSREAPSFETDDAGLQRLQYRAQGWSTWTWRGTGEKSFEINYIASGPVDGPRVLLVHGFGASSYHWRYQVADLAAKGYRVYSLCLLGYGWSERAVLPYSGEVWAAQINDFLKDVAGGPAVLVGNSIGAFAALLAASLDPLLCRGLVLLNAAGRFEERQPGEAPARKQAGDLVAEAEEQAEGPVQWMLQQLRKALAGWAFYTTKMRIQPILEWVYVNPQQVDDDLVTSIRAPAEHPDALEAFSEVIQAGRRTQVSVFGALDQLPGSLPILLIWGMQDPWMRPQRAAAIVSECAQRGLRCDLVEVADAGHCPQDDAPGAVNDALLAWMEEQEQLVTA